MPTPIILCVEDEPDVLYLVVHLLAREGYRVETAATGREALARIARRRPALLLLDLMLPDIDGFALCEILRHDPGTADIPIMVLSAWASADARNLGQALGALDYMAKPFSPRDLVARVNRLLKNAAEPSLRSE